MHGVSRGDRPGYATNLGMNQLNDVVNCVASNAIDITHAEAIQLAWFYVFLERFGERLKPIDEVESGLIFRGLERQEFGRKRDAPVSLCVAETPCDLQFRCGDAAWTQRNFLRLLLAENGVRSPNCLLKGSDEISLFDRQYCRETELSDYADKRRVPKGYLRGERNDNWIDGGSHRVQCKPKLPRM